MRPATRALIVDMLGYAALLLPMLGCLHGCASRDRVDQLTADLAASQFEAATAIEQGVPPAKPCAAIKAASAAIIYAHGRDYPPATDYLKALSAPKPETP
jgi:hypothetical protein